MKSKQKYLCILFILFNVSCLKKPVEFYIGDVNITNTITPIPMTGIVVYIENNDIYMFDSIRYALPKRLTNTPSIVKQNIDLAYTRNKVLYVETVGTNKIPVVIDTSGNELNRYTANANAIGYSWAGNSETIIINNRLSIGKIGTAVLTQSTPTYGVFSNSYYNFFAVSKNNDIFYSTWTSFGDFNKFDFYNPALTSINDGVSADRYSYKIKFSPDGSRLLIGEPDSPFGNGINEINIYDVYGNLARLDAHYEDVLAVQDVCIEPNNESIMFTYNEPLSSINNPDVSTYFFNIKNLASGSVVKRFHFTDNLITEFDWK